jgi:uncharacterized membrane protein YccC
MWNPKSLAVSLLLGLLIAGPLAALVLIALPEPLRGPVVPWTVAAVVVAVVLYIRRPGPDSA